MSEQAKTAMAGPMALGIFIIIADQISKYIANTQMAFGEQIPVLPFFNWVLVYNPGAALGILSGYPDIARWLFTSLAIVVSIGLTVWLAKTPKDQVAFRWALGLIIGGAVGNVIDRIWLGKVIDFLDFYWGSYHFPAFNVADIAISVGAGLIILDALLAGRQREN